MWYVSQIGRREHYALPAYLHRSGQLGLFATDIWAPWAASPRSLFRPEKLAQRFEASMNAAPVASRSFFANLIERVRPGDSYQRWTGEGRSFGAFASDAFGRAGLKAGDVVIGGKKLKPLEVEKLLAERLNMIETTLLDKYAELGIISVEA